MTTTPLLQPVTLGVVVPRAFSELITLAGATSGHSEPVVVEYPRNPGDYRGPVAVVSGTRIVLTATGRRIVEERLHLTPGRDAVRKAIAGLPTGAVVAVADIIDAHPVTPGCCRDLSGKRRTVWHVAFDHARVVPLAVDATGFPRGQVDLLPADVAALVNDQLERLAAA